MKFNINNYVWVKLTPKGEVKYQKHVQQCRAVAVKNGFVYRPATECKGYRKFQLWDLMRIFGDDMSMGTIPVFETTILIDEDPV